MSNHQNKQIRTNMICDNQQNPYTTAQSRIYFNSHIPPPISSNLRPCDSPASSPLRHSRSEQDDEDDFTLVTNKKRRNNDKNAISEYDQDKELLNNYYPNVYKQHQHRSSRFVTAPSTSNPYSNQQNQAFDQQQITMEAARYAQTRLPFPPFIIRFSSGNILEKRVAQEIKNYLKDNFQTDICIANIRRSTLKCQQNDYDFLIYVKDADSFCSLFDKHKWPQQICGENFSFPSTPSFPPQLSLIVKNVDLRINLDKFCADLKAVHTDIHNVIRLKNKFQNCIKLVKIEILSPTSRNEILSDGKLTINGITYDIEEYLAPASVLICSKCMASGHFKKQCKEINGTCKICGISCPDLRQHSCSLVTATKFNSNNYRYHPANFPPLPNPQRWTTNTNATNSVVTKIDELISSMAKVNISLERIISKNDQYEQFMNDKIKFDEMTSKKLDELITTGNNFKTVITQHQCKITRHENIFTKLIFPILDEISTFLLTINIDKHGGILDADFKVKINRMRAQLDNARLNKEI
ncbi:unnamed protein product [Rotaria sordida]|uniref:CCHC-type domain-containing protein n=2 Tax=Rotaria sordida TaxID=392033 RepID=A0A815CH46_9BILA|nr:unnamed protein product [Rotaria sordida]